THGSIDQEWDPIVRVTGDMDLFRSLYDSITRENVINFMVLDHNNPNSIISCVNCARENASSVREIISSEMWLLINRFYHRLNSEEAREKLLDNPGKFCEVAKVQSLLFHGSGYISISHGEAWHFSELGKQMERADNTSRILDVKYYTLLPKAELVGTSIDNMQWIALLKSTSALETYKAKHQQISMDKVLNFLILDHQFPRSVAYCVARADESLHCISNSPQGSFNNVTGKKMGKMLSDLQFTSVEEIIQDGMHEYLESFQQKINDVGNCIYDDYFSYNVKENPPKSFENI
ncbi:MAG: alpha-E domain-containing protein, partial [Candidatus Dadabacteria bacterium]|nr:alpha-E domain-containing protein [Candidatus Dadabacteria bacterium]